MRLAVLVDDDELGIDLGSQSFGQFEFAVESCVDDRIPAFTANLDGSALYVLDPHGKTSHFVWRDPATVTRVIQLVDRSEYKRRQAPPGVKITPRAFGRDRRMPLTNRYVADGQPRTPKPARPTRKSTRDN